jgi:hypothetical protein
MNKKIDKSIFHLISNSFLIVLTVATDLYFDVLLVEILFSILLGYWSIYFIRFSQKKYIGWLIAFFLIAGSITRGEAYLSLQIILFGLGGAYLYILDFLVKKFRPAYALLPIASKKTDPRDAENLRNKFLGRKNNKKP